MTDPWTAFVMGTFVGAGSALGLVVAAAMVLGARARTPPPVGRPDPWRGSDGLLMDRKGRVVDPAPNPLKPGTRTMFDD